ncbi:YsnF/AvaK domain-containing protein [Massilia antarctica]|uniref:YsnF/AvaK domain-containing protein n=1 Tax=Massilia antarctica TaxID=2765360 RepID=A0AA48WBG7_9BURK|nr:YsnF/AvaK domain-containing protein [Massilia antarctica]QPI48427.1 YsnF/AvaK domain-containing protein [Massilia antarctica]
MEHTLVALFDHRGNAQQALDDLVASGFSRQSMRLSDGGPGEPGRAAHGGEDESLGSSIKHFFSDLFGGERSEHARMYSEALARGHYVLTLTAPNEPEVERAADIVERHGPVDIDEHSGQWQGAMQGGDAMRTQPMSQQSAFGSAQGGGAGNAQGRPMDGSQQRAADTRAIPVIQEELKVGKREVQRGGVRIYQRIVETPVSESIGLREEHINVERRAVDKMVDPADIAAFQENTIELRETAEEAVVEKTARMVEEVIVGKQVTQRQEQINDTVRHTEVDIEQIAPDDDAYFRGHWSGNFAREGGNYDDYAPAYRYGTSMAGSALYRGRPWEEIEPGLRIDWEARNPGSTWEKMKAAIRHGWERMTS